LRQWLYYYCLEILRSKELCHYGVKGMKWGVKRTPEELGRKRETAISVEKTNRGGIIKKTFYGHVKSPRQAEPNAIIDYISHEGKVNKRSYYGPDGFKIKDIHTTDHKNPKEHPYGKTGEHAHDYTWNTDGTPKNKTIRELTEKERKENSDIL